MIHCHAKALSLRCLYSYRKPRWAEVGQTYIHIRRNCTLWFWRSKNLAVRAKLSSTKQRERLMGCIVYSPHWLRTALPLVVRRVNYILTLTWGFRRCSFRLTGQCEGLRIVERATELAPRFLFLYSKLSITFDFLPKEPMGMFWGIWNVKTVEKKFLMILLFAHIVEM